MGPPKKRARLSNDDEKDECDDDVPRHPVAVLADEYTDPVLFVKAVTCPILHKKDTSKIAKDLAANLPLTDLQHLRRIKPGEEKGSPLQVLLFPAHCLPALANEEAEEDAVSLTRAVHDYLQQHNICTDGLGPASLVSVAASRPLTRLQFEAAKEHWPVSFHEDKEITRKVRREVFTPQELRMHARHMALAAEYAHKAEGSGQAVGAVLVEPASGAVVAAGHDRRLLHPLQHATMVVIDLAAKAQGGTGAWQLHGPTSYMANVPPRGPGQDCAAGDPYLCTGYDLYITREPCTMCAMALVHSRIRTVFYGHRSPGGALGSVYKVHVQPGLNHHYVVYEGFLEPPHPLPDASNKTAYHHQNHTCPGQSGAGTNHTTPAQPRTETNHTIPGQPGVKTNHTTPGQPGTETNHTTPEQPGAGTNHTIPGKPGAETNHTTPGQPGAETIHTTPGQPRTETNHTTPGQPGAMTNYSIIPGKPGAGTNHFFCEQSEAEPSTQHQAMTSSYTQEKEKVS